MVSERQFMLLQVPGQQTISAICGDRRDFAGVALQRLRLNGKQVGGQDGRKCERGGERHRVSDVALRRGNAVDFDRRENFCRCRQPLLLRFCGIARFGLSRVPYRVG